MEFKENCGKRNLTIGANDLADEKKATRNYTLFEDFLYVLCCANVGTHHREEL